MLVRTVRDGDEPAIVELFNRVYNRYGGFVPRTVEYWRWCCLERPDVKRDGVFLAFEDGKLCGYAVAGSSGNIWEFCVVDDNEEATETLLCEAVSYLEKIGVSSVNVNIPSEAAFAKSLREAGFGEVPAVEMFVTTLNPAALVQALVTPRKESFVERFDDEFAFRLHDVPYGVSKEFFVRIRDASVEIAEALTAKPSIIVDLGFSDFLSVLFGGSSASRLFLSGKIKVRPFRKLFAVLAFLSAMRLEGKWFFPLSDCI